MDQKLDVKEMARKAKEVSRVLGKLSTLKKNRALLEMAKGLEENQNFLFEANRTDLLAGEKACLSSAMIDRLRITPAVIHSMATGLREVEF